MCFDLKYIYIDREEIMGYNCGQLMKPSDYLNGPNSAASKIYKRSFLKKLDFKFDPDMWCEDIAIIPTLCLHTDKIYYLKNVYYNYVQRNNSITNQTEYNPKTIDAFKALKIVKDEFDKNNKLVNYHDEVEFMFITNLLLTIPLKIYKYKESKPVLKEFNLYMKNNFSKWSKNKYYKQLTFKQRVYCHLFYRRLSVIIKVLYNIKHFFK